MVMKNSIHRYKDRGRFSVLRYGGICDIIKMVMRYAKTGKKENRPLSLDRYQDCVEFQKGWLKKV